MNDSSPSENVVPETTSTAPPPKTLPAAAFWGIVLAGALAASVISFVVGEYTHELYIAPKAKAAGASVPLEIPSFEGLVTADTKNAMITYGATAVIIALTSGIVAGIAAGSLRAALFGGALGAILGGSLTVLVTKGILMLYFKAVESAGGDSDLNLLIPLMVHGSIGAAIGLASGAAFAVGVGAKAKSYGTIVMSGLVGGLLGAVIYELVGGQLFPLSRTDRPIAEYWAARLVAVIAIAILGTAFSASGSRVKSKV